MSKDAPPNDPMQAGIRFMLPEEAMMQKEPEWLIEGILPAHSLSLPYGPSDCYKTFVAIDMAASIGTGLDWHEHKVQQGVTAYIVAEGDDAFPKRLQAWAESRGVRVADTRVCQLHQPIYLLEDDMLAALVEALGALQAQVDLPIRLVVFDTLSMCLGDGKENVDMPQAAMALNYIRQKTGAHVLAIHHEGHVQGRPRGHSALQGNWPTRIRFTKPEEMACRLTCQKQANSRRFDPLTLHLAEREVVLPSGKHDTSLAVIDEAGPAVPQHDSRRKHTLGDALAIYNALPAPVSGAALGKALGVGRSSGNDWLQRLAEAGYIQQAA